MLTTFIERRGNASRKFAAGLCAVFLTTYIGVFNIEVKCALAQEKFGEPTPQIQANFGTSTATTINSTYSGLKGLLFGTSGQYNANGNYTNTSTNYYSNKFGSPTPQQYQNYINQNSGVSGFFKSLFSGTGTSTSTTTTSNTTYPLTNGYVTGATTFGSPVNSTIASTGTAATRSTANLYTTVNTNTAYSNQYKTLGKQVGGTLGSFIGGSMDLVSFSGNKVVSAGNVAINGLANAKGAINNGMAAATSGLVGTFGKVLGFGGRVIAGAAKAALTIPMLAIKAGVYLTAVATAGTVRILGAGLNALRNVTDSTTAGIGNLSTQTNNLYTNVNTAFGNSMQNVNYQVNSTATQNFNNQTFGYNLNNTITYANTLQQTTIANQGLVGVVQTSAANAMNDFSANTQIAKLSIIEVGRKLAYNTAVLLHGAASNSAVALSLSIKNIETAKTQLKSLKAMNDNGVINPAVYKQYLSQIKTQLDQAQASLKTTSQSINSAYLTTLSNINGTRNYLNQNNVQITNQMNQFGYYTSYTISANSTTYGYLSQLNQYNTNLTTLNNTYNNTYNTIQNSNNFGNSGSGISNTTSTASTLKSLIGLNESGSAERQVSADAASSDNTISKNQSIETSTGGENAESKAAYDKYMAAYNKYTTVLANDSDNSAEVDKALDEYKTAYENYQQVYQKSLSGK